MDGYMNKIMSKIAKDWWASNNKFWKKVRNSWDEIYNRNGKLSLHKSIDEQPLFMHFYSLEKDNAKRGDISSLLQKFITDKSISNVKGK